MYFPIAIKTPVPYSDTENAIRDMTPSGDVSIIKDKTLNVTAEALLISSLKSFPFSPAFTAATAMMTVAIMVGRTAPFTSGARKLSGTMPVRTSPAEITPPISPSYTG